MIIVFWPFKFDIDFEKIPSKSVPIIVSGLINGTVYDHEKDMYLILQDINKPENRQKINIAANGHYIFEKF